MVDYETPVHVLFKTVEHVPILAVRSDRCSFAGLLALERTATAKHGELDYIEIAPPIDLNMYHTVIIPPKTLTGDGWRELTLSLLCFGVPIAYSPGKLHVYDNDSISDSVETVADAWNCVLEAGGREDDG